MKNSILIFFFLCISLTPCFSNEIISNNSDEEISRSSIVINSIEFYGNKIVIDDKIKEYISLKVGESFDSNKIKKDIKNLYSTGYFYKIDVLTTETEKGLDLLFRFEENPVLADLRITGNSKISEKDINEVVGLTEGRIISRKKLEITRSIVEQLYLFKGFNKVVVRDDILPVGEGKIQYELKIVEGRRGYVKGIELIGVDENYIDELSKAIQTKEKWFFSLITGRGRLSMDLIELDENNIKQFYLGKGFVDIKTDQARVEYIPEKDGYKVVFKVNQGARYKRGVVSLSGDLIKEEKDIFDSISLDDSEYFSAKLLNNDIKSLNRFYGNEAYAFANINPNIKKDEEQKIIHVEYDIEKGDKFKINLINIKGNTRTRDKVIRREILINEDDYYSSSKIDASKSRINRRGFFETVEVSEKPAENKANYLDLEVEVEEKSTGYFSIAGGYSSIETILLGVNIQENNLFGYGKKLGASATIGGLSKNFYLNYSDPYFLDTNYQFGFTAFKRLYDYIDYDKDSWGGRLNFAKSLNYWTYANMTYRYENSTIDDLKNNASEIFQVGTDRVSSIRLGLIYDTRDSFLDPTKGISSGAGVEESNEIFGANLYFTKYSANFSKYYEIKRNHTMAYSMDGGFIDFRDIGNRIVVSQRYYLGGPDNLRGYKNARISPRRMLTNGDFVRIGGNKYVFTSLEYLYPVALEAGLKGILFIDVGEVYDESKNIDYNPMHMRRDVGFGFRWISPMGPLKLDFGFPLGKRRSGEDKYEVQFSIGSLF